MSSQDTVQQQIQRKAEIESYQLLLTEIETWLTTLTLTVPELDDNEPNTIATIKQYQENAKALKEKEKTLVAIKAKCDNLCEHSDVRPLTESLSEQLTIMIEVIRNQMQLISRQITVLESHLNKLRTQAVRPSSSESTIGSSPMPEISEVESQISQSLQTPNYPDGVAHIEQQTSFVIDRVQPVDTVDTSMQTRENKQTDNILISQTVSDGGRETIKFESAPNPIISEQVEDVYVDARYQQPNDPHRTTELVLRNVPQTSFETTFVEPDDTTTEVVVDADGRKTIIVRKVTRTVQQHRVIEQRQQLTEVSSIVGTDNQPIEQTISQINAQNQSVSNTVSDGSGSKTISVHQSQASLATGDDLGNLIVQEVIQAEPIVNVSELQQRISHEGGIEFGPTETQTDVQHSSIQTVVHHVSRKIIRRKKRIIRRVTVIDGKEHVTEEVIEEPEEIEESENEIPNVNVNIVRNTIITKEGETSQPIVELAAEELLQTEYTPEPIDIVAQTPAVDKKPKKDTKGKKEREKSRKLKEQKQDEKDEIQVFEIKPAPVDLAIDNAHVDNAALPDTTLDVEKTVDLPAQTTEIETALPETESQVIEQNIVICEQPESELAQEPEITNINEIWPPNEPSDHSQPASHTTSVSIDVTDSINLQPTKDDSIRSQEIWPLDEKTGHSVVLETYTFEKETPSPVKEELKSDLPIELEENITITEIVVEEKSKSASPEKIEATSSEQIEQVIPEQIESSETPKVDEISVKIDEIPVFEEPSIVETTTISISEIAQPEKADVEDSSSKTYSIHDDKPTDESDNKKDKKKKKKSKKKKTEDKSDGDISSRPISAPKSDDKSEIVISTTNEKTEIDVPQGTHAQISVEKIDLEVPPQPENIVLDVQTIENIPTDTTPIAENVEQSTEEPELSLQLIEEEKVHGKPVTIEIKTTKTTEVFNIVAEEANIEEPSPELPAVPIEPVILIDEVKSVDRPLQEEPTQKDPPKEEAVAPVPQKPKIDVRTATQLFIDNELNVSDATTRTVKVSLTPNESTSPGSLMIKMKLEPNDQPNLNVNIVEETTIQQDTEKLETEVDPSVIESVELDIGDDNTISEKMEMPEIESTPIQIDDKMTINIEQKAALSPDETYKSISEISNQLPVKIVEESILSSGSDSPKPIGAQIIIATDILEEQITEDVEQQTSPVQIGDTQETLDKPVVDLRSVQTSPDVRQTIDVTQQTSPIQQVDGGIQTDYSVHEIEIQTSPIPIGNAEESREPIPTANEEVQTDAPDADTSEKSIQINVSMKDEQTSPRSDIQTDQEIIDASDVVPHIAGKLVSDIIQAIPIQIPTKDEHTTTEIIEKTEVNTQTLVDNSAGEPSKVEPYEIEIKTSILVPEDASVKQSDEPVVIEIKKTFVIEEGDPTTVREIEKPQKSKSKKKKNKKSKTASEQFIEIESQKLPDLPSSSSPVPGASVEEVIAESEEISPSPIPGASVEEVTAEPEEISPRIKEKETLPPSPTKVTLNITKTTVFDTSNIVGVEQQLIEKERKLTQRRPSGSVSSVTIEEVQSTIEEMPAVPITPDVDNIEVYSRSEQPDWNEQLIAASVQSTSELAPIPSSSIQVTTQPQKEWQQAIHVITDRIKNTQNAQKARLSNVLHLTSLAESATPESIKERATIIEDNLDKLEDATTTKNTVIIHETVIRIIEEISTWLETIEYRVYLNRQNSGDGPSEDKIDELDNLLGELNSIESNVNSLSHCLEKTGKTVDPIEQQQMTECLDNLKKQISAVETVTKESNDETRDNLKRWTEYITIVETINTTITQLGRQLDGIQRNDTPLSERLEHLDILERKNSEQIDDINRGIQLARGLNRDFPGKTFPVDIYASYENARNFGNSLELERNRLLQLESLAEDYEQTLNQFGQIILLAETVVEQPIEARDLDELHQEMQKHRKFFVNLNHCRTILDSLKENIDSESRNKHAELHNSLHEKASQILEKASDRSQRISLAASRWTILKNNLREEKQWLQVAQQRVPDLSEVSTVDYERYITMYKSICTDANQHHARSVHLTNLANKLQDLVKTPNIQEECNDCLSALLKLKDELKVYLNRLTTFRDVWTMYETKTDHLEQWILQSERELARIEQTKELRVQPTEDTRRFWEIRVHYEVNNNLRNEIGNTLERSIQILPIRDELMQRQFHQQLEDRWANISRKIDSIQSSIISGLSSEEMPIDEKIQLLRRELNELQIAFTSSKSVIKNEDELNIYTERMQLLNNRLCIIYNELGRLSLLPSHHPEEIGQLFALSQNISGPVSEEIENSLLLKNALSAIQNGIKRMRQTQENNVIVLNACESSEKLSSDQIELAVIDCQHLVDELDIRWQEIMHLRQLLHTLPMRLRVSVSPVKLERDLSQLQDNHAEHESRCKQILNLLKNRLSLWKRFERQLELVQQTNNETEFMMDLLKLNGQVDYDRLKKTTEHLEVSDTFKIYFFFLI